MNRCEHCKQWRSRRECKCKQWEFTVDETNPSGFDWYDIWAVDPSEAAQLGAESHCEDDPPHEGQVYDVWVRETGGATDVHKFKVSASYSIDFDAREVL